MIKNFNLFLILLTSLVVFALQNKLLIISLSLLLFFFVLSNLRYIKFSNINLIASAILIIILMPALKNSYYDVGAIYYLTQTLVIFLLATIIVKKYDINDIIQSVRNIYYLIAIIIYLGIYNYRNEHEPLSYLIDGSSTNGITSYLIIFQIFYSSLYFIKFTKLPVYTALNTATISVIGYGRGSIIIGLLLIAFSMVINFNILNQVKLSKKILFMVVLIFFSSIFFVFWNDIVNFFELYTKLGNGVVDEARAEIFDSYVSDLDHISFFFGLDYINTIISTQYSGNPHISYIRTHHTFGLFFTLIVLLSPLIFIVIEKNKFKASVLSILSIFSLLRAASEPILFPTLLDLFYIMPFIILLNRRNYASLYNRKNTCKNFPAND